MPLRPTRMEAEAALQYLETVIRAFPFVEKADRSVALSGILTALDRRSMMTAPLHAFTAPSPRTGKSLLVDVASLLATGEPAPVIAQESSQEELKKELDTALVAANPIISIDNCDRELTSPRLCQMLTQQRIMIRLLGYTRQVEVLSNATLFATGNNLTIADDLTDRTLLCSLDAGIERPGTRRFDFDLKDMIYRERERLVIAALTVLAAWHAAGMPAQPIDPFGGFEDWSRRVREPLVWLGRADPCLTMTKVRERDPERAALEAVLKCWESSYLHRGQKQAHTVEQIKSAGLVDSNLHAALVAVAGNTSGLMVVNDRLGRWLRKSEGKIVSGLKLERHGIANGYPLWRLVRV
jgi:putative DNA primase/helicase